MGLSKPDWEVKSAPQILYSPLVPLVARAWLELEENGWGDGGVPAGTEDAAFYIEAEGIPVAFLAWRLMEWKRATWIALGWVAPEYRRQGMYSALFAALVKETKRRGLRAIGSGTAYGNTAMQQAAEKQGRKAVSIEYEYLVNAEKTGTVNG